MKKTLNFVFFIITMFCFTLSVNALTKYEFDDWTVGGQYGTKEKISNNITRLKEANGSGPFSKASTAKLKDGIVEETYVNIDFASIKKSELFEISLALRNGNDEYVSEAVVMTQKVTDDKIDVTAGWAPNFKVTIMKNGIYTYQWKMFIENGKTYVKFTLLNYDEIIGTTGNIDLDTIVTKDTKNPVAGQNDVSVKYLWFCNIDIENGIDVYSVLPSRQAQITEVPESNPDTSDNVSIYFTFGIIGLIFTVITSKNLIKN